MGFCITLLVYNKKCQSIKKQFYNNHASHLNFMAPFHGWSSTASKIEPLREGSLLFTTKFPEILVTHFIDLGRMKGWVDLEATQWFLDMEPVDWESSILTTRPLLHKPCSITTRPLHHKLHNNSVSCSFTYNSTPLGQRQILRYFIEASSTLK